MGRPNLFLVGAPRCGTTAMYLYLRAHPEIYLSPDKEPNFFARDIFKRIRMTEAEYLALFDGARDERWLGEASPHYLRSRVAAGLIKGFSPDARILIHLRDPVDMVVSMHQHLVFHGLDLYLDLERSLKAEVRRERSGRQPSVSQAGFTQLGASYYELAAYTDQVKRYFDVFGRENVHVTIYDDFRKDTAAAYAEVLRFLQIEAGFVPDTVSARGGRVRMDLQGFPVINAGHRVRSRTLHKALILIWPFLRKSAVTDRFMRRLADMNSYRGGSLPPSPNVRQHLAEHFRPEMERLSELLGRDLTHWSQPIAP